MISTLTYPLFFVTKKNYVAVMPRDSTRDIFLPVFTDEHSALAFCNKKFAGWTLGGVADPQRFRKLLLALREQVLWVIFDPYSAEDQMDSIPINQLIEQLGT